MDVLDKAVYEELRDAAGADFVVELVATFMEEAPIMLADLKRARQQGDGDLFRRSAHSLKSNGATFGALHLASQARALELGGLSPDAAPDLAAISRLEAAYQQAAAALQELARG